MLMLLYEKSSYWTFRAFDFAGPFNLACALSIFALTVLFLFLSLCLSFELAEMFVCSSSNSLTHSLTVFYAAFVFLGSFFFKWPLTFLTVVLSFSLTVL